MIHFFLIFFGAGLGGMLRFYFSRSLYALWGQEFPYGTLLVNVSGCFFMGFLYIFLLDRHPEMSTELRAFLLIGFLGGYTTFSSFAIETFLLAEKAAWVGAFLNIILSFTLCMTAVWLGVLGGRRL